MLTPHIVSNADGISAVNFSVVGIVPLIETFQTYPRSSVPHGAAHVIDFALTAIATRQQMTLAKSIVHLSGLQFTFRALNHTDVAKLRRNCGVFVDLTSAPLKGLWAINNLPKAMCLSL